MLTSGSFHTIVGQALSTHSTRTEGWELGQEHLELGCWESLSIHSNCIGQVVYTLLMVPFHQQFFIGLCFFREEF